MKQLNKDTVSLMPPAMWHDANDMKWAARHWATRIGVKTPIIQVRAMSRKWGSMSTAGRMTLNAELLGLPKDIGEFVIVHELVHLLAPDHGKLFKLFMSAYMPDWQSREKDLRAYERKKLLAEQRAQRRKENKAAKVS